MAPTFPLHILFNSWNVPGQSGKRGAFSHLAKTNIIFWVGHSVSSQCTCNWQTSLTTIFKTQTSIWDFDLWWQIGDKCCKYNDMSRRNRINRCIWNTFVSYWYIFKACSSTWQIGDGCCDFTDNGSRNGSICTSWVCYQYILRDCIGTWRIGYECCYYTDIGRKYSINRCICDTCVCYWYILKACNSRRQTGDYYTTKGEQTGDYYTDLGRRKRTNWCVCNTCVC